MFGCQKRVALRMYNISRRKFFTPWVLWLFLSAFAWPVLTILILNPPLPSVETSEILTDFRIYSNRSNAETPQRLVNSYFTPADLNQGIPASNHSVWVRFTVLPTSNYGSVILWMLPATGKDFRIFSQEPNGKGWISFTSDSVTIFRGGSWPFSRIGFQLPATVSPVTYYLNAPKSVGTSIRITTLSQTLAEIQVNTGTAAQMLFLSLLTMGLLLAAFQFAIIRTYTTFTLGASHGACMLVSVYILNLPEIQLTDKQIVDPLFMLNLALASACTLSVLFHRLFLKQFEPARWALWLADGLVLAGIVKLAFSSIVDIDGDSFLILAYFGSCLFSILAMSLTLRSDGSLSLAIVRSIYAAHLAGYIAIACASLSFATPDARLRFIVLSCGLMSTSLILVLTSIIKQSKEHLRRVAANIRDQDQIKLDIAARNSTVQDQMMNMLAHEMRNHLAIARMSMPKFEHQSEGARQIAKSIAKLNDVVTDCVQASWLSRDEWKPRNSVCAMHDLIHKLRQDSPECTFCQTDFPETATILTDPDMLIIGIRQIVRAMLGESDRKIFIRIKGEFNSAPEFEPPRLLTKAYTFDIESIYSASTDDHRFFQFLQVQSGCYHSQDSLNMSNAREIISLIGGKFLLSQNEGIMTCSLWLPVL